MLIESPYFVLPDRVIQKESGNSPPAASRCDNRPILCAIVT